MSIMANLNRCKNLMFDAEYLVTVDSRQYLQLYSDCQTYTYKFFWENDDEIPAKTKDALDVIKYKLAEFEKRELNNNKL